MAGGSFIAREGHNCWRRTVAGRAAFLVDGAAYYHALRLALEKAERSVFVLGWEFDSRTRLERGQDQEPTIADLFHRSLRSRPQLQIYVLIWNSALIYSLDREFLPVLKHDWLSHRRLHFRLDDCHPLGASHHQKMVVIDDSLAFVGGLDIAAKRWDTSEHAPADPRRSDPGYPAYGPFHDVQIAVSGTAAAALGDLCRHRWRTATGQILPAPRPAGNVQWPDGLVPDVEEAAVAIARTGPPWGGAAPVTELRTLLVDLLNAARTAVYIENQYFASRLASRWLARRLGDADCPEVAVVTSGVSAGWLEERTMGLSRDFFLTRLRAADRHRRLGFYCPLVAGRHLKIHSKLMIIDDRYLCIGSSNLNNRSLGLDSECNLLLDGSGRADVQGAIAGLRNRLLAEHLGGSPAVVAAAVADLGLHGAIRHLGRPGRQLAPLVAGVGSPAGALELRALDPEGPLEATVLEAGPAGWRLVAGFLMLVGLTALSTLAPPVSSLPATMTATLRDDPLSPLLLGGIFLMFGVTGLPMSLPMVAAGWLFGACEGGLYALLGALASAAFSYSLGRAMGRPRVLRLTGRRIRHLGRALVRHGVVAMAVLRFLPVTSFASVSLAAGALGLPPKTYFTGTLVGCLPAAVAFSLFGDRFAAQLQDPRPANMVQLTALALLATLAAAAVVVRMARTLTGRRR